MDPQFKEVWKSSTCKSSENSSRKFNDFFKCDRRNNKHLFTLKASQKERDTYVNCDKELKIKISEIESKVQKLKMFKQEFLKQQDALISNDHQAFKEENSYEQFSKKYKYIQNHNTERMMKNANSSCNCNPSLRRDNYNLSNVAKNNQNNSHHSDMNILKVSPKCNGTVFPILKNKKKIEVSSSSSSFHYENNNLNSNLKINENAVCSKNTFSHNIQKMNENFGKIDESYKKLCECIHKPLSNKKN